MNSAVIYIFFSAFLFSEFTAPIPTPQMIPKAARLINRMWGWSYMVLQK